MKLNEIKDVKESKISIEDLLEALGEIFDDEDESQDDTMKLRDLNLRGAQIVIGVESLTTESDLTAFVSIRNGGVHIQIGSDDPIGFRFGNTAKDTAYSILSRISHVVEEHDDQERDEEFDEE